MPKYPKPPKLPRFATGVGAVVTEPSEAKKDIGWIAERPPYQYQNWWTKLVSDFSSFTSGKVNDIRGRTAFDLRMALSLGLDYSPGRDATIALLGAQTDLFYAYGWVFITRDNQVDRVDPATGIYSTSLNLGMGSRGMAYDGEFLYVAGATALFKIDPETFAVVDSQLVGFATNFGVIYDGTKLWVADTQSIHRVNPSTLVIEATVVLGSNVTYGLAFDGTHIWIALPTAGHVKKINIATDVVDATIPTGTLPISCIWDGEFIWVVDGILNDIDKINISTDAIVNTVGLGTGPGIGGFDGIYIFIPNHVDGTISQLDIRNDTVVATLTTGTSPKHCFFDGIHIWTKCGIPATTLNRLLP